MASASLRISTFYLVIVILGLFSARATFADEVSEIAENKEIDAKAYDLKTIRPSKSGRVYLFQKTEDGFPVDGKIFLLRQGDTPVMAFRVLKSYPDTKRIAAKKLLPYEGFAKLEKGSEYRAYEKVGDKVKPVPPSPEDLKDLKELESESPEELPPPPPAEDPTTTELHEPAPGEPLGGANANDVPPPPEDEKLIPVEEKPTEEKPAEALSEEPRDVDLEMKDSEEEDEADEVGSYFPNFFTVETGLLFDSKVPGPSSKFSMGLLYSRIVGRALDSGIALEGGLFYYQSSGAVNGSTISTTIIPVLGTIRYQRRYSDLWTPYGYAGAELPIVASNVGATKKQLAQMQSPFILFGGGTFIQTGPNWFMRLNLGFLIGQDTNNKIAFGFENLTLGVTLRF
jgi:hypothetical protein